MHIPGKSRSVRCFVSRLSVRVTAVFIIVLFAGCAAQQETVRVTERAPVVPTPSTEPRAPVEVVDSPRPGRAAAERRMSVEPGRFDGGKMWTFEDPPLAYFEEAYAFKPGPRWFQKARLGALRFSTYCSASFVSPAGLVMTNHHCGRQSVTDVKRSGENLLDDGFFSSALEEERRVKGLYVDQLIATTDVTKEVYAAARNVVGDDKQVEARQRKAEQIEKRMLGELASTDSSHVVEVIELYNGGKYSAYTFKRYRDVRLVMAPELQIGFFGGDPDNFTYPRYNLDVSFFRVYGSDGEPLRHENYFRWSANGATEGDAVFVVGNPGSTSRLSTVSQLEYERDVALPQRLRVLSSRSAILKSFIDERPAKADELDLRNTWFSLENSIKANTGQLRGLKDPNFLARKRAAEEKLRGTLLSSDSLAVIYGTLFKDIADMQRAKRAVSDQSGAFQLFTSDALTSHVLLRAFYGYVHDVLKQRMAPKERLDEVKKAGLAVSNWPKAVEVGFLAARLGEMRDYLGGEHPTVKGILKGRQPLDVARAIVDTTALIDSTGFAQLLDKGYLTSGDATVDVIKAIAPLYFSLGQQISSFEGREKNLNAKLARAQFAVHGTAVPPDASFSLRLADGVVAPYDYNGTRAPSYTTLYGLYDRYYSHQQSGAWALPDRWRQIPEELDLGTPVNLVTTNDITGGNSGSPLLNQNLEIVGLVFDSNIEALPNEYIYIEDAGRTISVDSRGILEVLDAVYDMDRIVLELQTGQLASTEAEADAILGSAN